MCSPVMEIQVVLDGDFVNREMKRGKWGVFEYPHRLLQFIRVFLMS